MRNFINIIVAGMLAISTVSIASNNYHKHHHSPQPIAGIYQGYIPEFNEPITLRLDKDGNAQYITTPELTKETTAIGKWKRVSSKHGQTKIKLATVVYIQEEFCGQLFQQEGLIDCIIYGGGTVTISKDGHLRGPYSFSFAPSAEPNNVIGFGEFTLDMKRQSIDTLMKKAQTPPTE